MDSVIRLLLRFILVPLGYLAAVLAGVLIVMFGAWKVGAVVTSADPDVAAYGTIGLLIGAPIVFAVALTLMFLPASVGILISEAFAIRSWIYHALCGAAAGWVGWLMFSGLDKTQMAPIEVNYAIAAGLAGGFAYWAVAGWSAGFWKPVFARPAPLPSPAAPAPHPFDPPARTGAAQLERPAPHGK